LATISHGYSAQPKALKFFSLAIGAKIMQTV